ARDGVEHRGRAARLAGLLHREPRLARDPEPHRERDAEDDRGGDDDRQHLEQREAAHPHSKEFPLTPFGRSDPEVGACVPVVASFFCLLGLCLLEPESCLLCLLEAESFLLVPLSFFASVAACAAATAVPTIASAAAGSRAKVVRRTSRS